MKLRNKKTGDIWEFDSISMRILDTTMEKLKARGWSGSCFANSISELNEEWEDYKPAEPLIKDEKIRKAVRAWAEVNDYKKCYVRVCDYDIGGICSKDGTTTFVSCETRLVITFFGVDLGIKTEIPYTINELCGEEEE